MRSQGLRSCGSKAKIQDKDGFNERTRSALMTVAHLSSLELRLERLGPKP